MIVIEAAEVMARRRQYRAIVTSASNMQSATPEDAMEL